MPKGSILYHLGNLAVDRLKNQDAHIMAHKMMRLYERGEYYLVQRRRFPKINIFEYWAVPVQRRVEFDPRDF
jgi:hypothetical protein